MTDYIINFTDPLTSGGSFVIKPYTSDGNRFPTSSTRAPSAVAANSVLLLYGKGHPNYGERTNENLLTIAENFSGASRPIIDSSGNTLTGVIWHREVLYARDTTGAPDWYFWDQSTTSWVITSVTEGLLAARPATAADGALFFATDVPALYLYSDDERGLQQWIEREYEEAAGAPAGDPTRDLQVNHDGTSTGWAIIPDTTSLDTTYLRLDTTNDPLTGDLEIATTTPRLTLTGSDPVVRLAGSDPTVQFSGSTNFHVAENTDTLEIRVGVTPGADTWFVADDTNDYLTHGNRITAAAYASNITGVTNALANVQYVNNQVTATGLSDSFVVSSFTVAPGSPATLQVPAIGSPPVAKSTFTAGVLTLAVTPSHPETPSFDISNFVADQIPFTPTGTIVSTDVQAAIDEVDTQNASLTGATFTGPVDFTLTTVTGGTPASGTQLANKDYVDGTVASSSIEDAPRDVQTPFGGSPTQETFTLSFSYVAGTNRLMVFKNGVKQYLDIQAHQDALFTPAKTNSSTIAGLPAYQVLSWTGGSPGAWIIDGHHAGSPSEFTAGNTIRVDDAIGISSRGYTVLSATNLPGSPATTAVFVAEDGGSPQEVVGSQFPTTVLGIDYEFRLSVDGGPLVNIRPINGIDVSTFGDLVNEINTSPSLIGPGSPAFNVEAYMFDGNIRFRVLSPVPPGSPTQSILVVDGDDGVSGSPSTSTDALFSNLIVDGFTSLNLNVDGVQYGYIEDDGFGNAAAGGTTSNLVTLNTPPLVTDVFEFIEV